MSTFCLTRKVPGHTFCPYLHFLNIYRIIPDSY